MRIACVQSNVFFGHPDWNAEAAESKLAEVHADGVDLAIFPEAYLTGYSVETPEDARALAISRSHPALDRVQRAAERLGVTTIVGFAEDDCGDLFNCAALFEPGVEARFYRKSHLPELGFDKHAGRGDELPVFETKHGKIGILICFDQRLPEPARVLALNGAQLIALPTNWPVGAENSADVMCRARAAENRVFMATSNRVGTENGFTFIGRSKIIGVGGEVLASAGANEKTIVAEIDLPEARKKRTVNVPGKYEMTIFKCRRPELYGDLMDEDRNVEEIQG